MAEPKKKSGCLMTLFKAVLVLILLLVAVFFGVGYFVLDGKYEVARDTTIKAPAAAVHQQVGDLREWPNWLPFTKMDPGIQVAIEQPTGVGASQHWTGKDGKGKLKFTESDENKGIAFDMLFDETYASKGSLTYDQAGTDTKVTWRMTGQNNDLIGKWLALAMPTMVGPAFEQGLADLKKKVEAK